MKPEPAASAPAPEPATQPRPPTPTASAAPQPPGSTLVLGQAAGYPDRYDPSLLCPLPRAPKRAEIGLNPDALPFLGADLWCAYELSWLNPRGKPQVAILGLTVPCESPNLIESKSLKLYLNSFNQTVLDSADALLQHLRQDLNAALWRGSERQGGVGLRLWRPAQFAQLALQPLAGLSLDRLDLECSDYLPAPEHLSADHSQSLVDEVLCSDLLKSNCLVTGQPDWASVQIAYVGAPMDQAGLLRYLVSFRQHSEFHEQCVERIYTDIWQRCRPTRLSVLARYTRRGGIDISPWRSSHPQQPPGWERTPRQ